MLGNNTWRYFILAPQTYLLGGTPLRISSNIDVTISSIDGDGAVLDAQFQSRVLEVTGSSNATFRGVRFRGGKPPDFEPPEVIAFELGPTGSRRALQTNANDGGGGLLVNSFSTVTLENCTVTGCVAGRGGGAFCTDQSVLHLVTTEVSECKGFQGGGSGEGGALAVTDGAAVFLRIVLVQNCFANGDGGALVATAGAVVSLSDVVLHNCSAAGSGGALAAAASADVSLSDVVVDSCSADGNGGALAVAGGAVVSLSDVVVQNCSALGAAGGALAATGRAALFLSNVVVQNCRADRAAGVWLSGATLSMNSSSISNVVAATGIGPPAGLRAASRGEGGGGILQGSRRARAPRG
eukprot:875099-Pleurochrysis_carterae.AAC.4